MSEIKTCEQYVLARLSEKENEVERLQNRVADLTDRLEALNDEYYEIFDILRRRCSISTSTSGSEYITFDSPWEKFDANNDKRDFAIIKSLLQHSEEVAK